MLNEFGDEVKVSDREKRWAVISHASSFLGLLVFTLTMIFEVFLFLLKFNIVLFIFGEEFKLKVDPDIYNLFYLLIPVVINIIIPLSIWKSKKSISEFVEDHCRQSLNFQLSVTFYFIISFAAIFIAVGVILLIVLVIFDFYVVKDAINKAMNDQEYRYPMAIHFIH